MVMTTTSGRTESLLCWDEGNLQKGRMLCYLRGWTRGDFLVSSELMVMCLFDRKILGL